MEFVSQNHELARETFKKIFEIAQKSKKKKQEK
jgi:hypothetical protein